MSIQKIKVMTYNVHSCRGIDGRVRPERIAEVIEAFDPDIVGLQELDVNRRSTNNIDQPLVIAQELRMHLHFQPALAVEGEHYGIAVLSRYPFEIKKAGHLPVHPCVLPNIPVIDMLHQPREAIWCSVKVNGKELYFVNTHLGLRSQERCVQAAGLLDEAWLGEARKEGKPMILCGDFNAGSGSRPYQLLAEHFQEAKATHHPRRRKTFISFLPFMEVDHIFFNEHLRLERHEIPRTALTKIASDHLPVIAEFSF